jgi:hypothetical protein
MHYACYGRCTYAALLFIAEPNLLQDNIEYYIRDLVVPGGQRRKRENLITNSQKQRAIVEDGNTKYKIYLAFL